MAQPPAYNRKADFTKNHGSVQNDELLNAELDDISTSINCIRENIATVIADDGGLKAKVVHLENLADDVLEELIKHMPGEVQTYFEQIRAQLEEMEQRLDALEDLADVRHLLDLARQYAEAALVLAGFRGNVCRVYLADGMRAGQVVTLPLQYVAGQKMMAVSYGGMVLYPGIAYEEMGDDLAFSNQIRMLVDLQGDGYLTAWLPPVGNPLNQAGDFNPSPREIFLNGIHTWRDAP